MEDFPTLVEDLDDERRRSSFDSTSDMSGVSSYYSSDSDFFSDEDEDCIGFTSSAEKGWIISYD